jgi:serine/threonine protein kinase
VVGNSSFFSRICGWALTGLADNNLNEGVIHGDIKPQNVLIFMDQRGTSFTAKLTDFGYSTITANTELIFMPKSSPWHAPEHQSSGVTRSEAKAMDAYSLGMLCFWLVIQGLDGYPKDLSIPQLKASDELRTTAYELLASLDMKDEQRRNLETFFNSTPCP